MEKNLNIYKHHYDHLCDSEMKQKYKQYHLGVLTCEMLNVCLNTKKRQR